jgi:hypothetical protein
LLFLGILANDKELKNCDANNNIKLRGSILNKRVFITNSIKKVIRFTGLFLNKLTSAIVTPKGPKQLDFSLIGRESSASKIALDKRGATIKDATLIRNLITQSLVTTKIESNRKL